MAEVWGEGQDSQSVPSIPVKVNGEVVGGAPATDTLAEVAGEFSQSHGLRTFNVLVNGVKADDKTHGSQTLRALGATSVELVAKDARGSK
jgi:hypothetical protein